MEDLCGHPAFEHFNVPVALHVLLDGVEAVEGGLDYVGRYERLAQERGDAQPVDRKQPLAALGKRFGGTRVYAFEPLVDLEKFPSRVLVAHLIIPAYFEPRVRC